MRFNYYVKPLAFLSSSSSFSRSAFVPAFSSSFSTTPSFHPTSVAAVPRGSYNQQCQRSYYYKTSSLAAAAATSFDKNDSMTPSAKKARTALDELSEKTGEFVRRDAAWRNWVKDGMLFLLNVVVFDVLCDIVIDTEAAACSRSLLRQSVIQTNNPVLRFTSCPISSVR